MYTHVDNSKLGRGSVLGDSDHNQSKPILTMMVFFGDLTRIEQTRELIIHSLLWVFNLEILGKCCSLTNIYIQ